MQVAASLFDHRFQRAGIFDAVRDRRVACFVRSVYLQGLLLMPEADIPDELRQVIPLRRQLHTLAQQAGLEVSALAIRYVLGLPSVTCAVIGAESVEQMRSNLALFSTLSVPIEMMHKIDEIVPSLPDKILLPNHWSTRMPDAIPVGR